MRRDVVVIGAGIVGTAIASRLTREDRHVLVLDRAREVGAGATAEGMGHIVAMDDSEAQFALTRYSQQLWDALIPELPTDCETIRPGTLWVAEDDDEMQAVHDKHRFYRERGVTAEVLAARDLAECEPNLRRGLVGALRVPGDSVVYPPTCALALLARAAKERLQLRLGADVVRAEPRRVTLADGSEIEADEVIVASGTTALDLLPTAPEEVAIKPRKGHLCITDRAPGFLRHQIVELGYLKSAHSADADSVAFNVQPRATGQVLVGSSRQFDKTTREVEPPLVARMIDRALHFMPGLARLPLVRTWTGFRAATADHLPVIGRVSDGLLLAAGHEGLGITTSLATAELICDELAGRSSAIDRRPYGVRREVAHA